jgi:hypothetical protein
MYCKFKHITIPKIIVSILVIGYMHIGYASGGSVPSIPTLQLPFTDALEGFGMRNSAYEIGWHERRAANKAIKEFIKIVREQKGKGIDDAAADELIRKAQAQFPQGTFTDMVKGALQSGLEEGVRGTIKHVATTVLTSPFKNLQSNMHGFFGLLGLYMYKLAFGSLGLSWSTLAKLNNRIYNICSPFTSAQLEIKDRKRRAELTGSVEGPVGGSPVENSVSVENNWLSVKEELLKELEHAIDFLKRSSNAYNGSYKNYSFLNPKFHVGHLVHSFAPHDNQEVCFYIDRSIQYIGKLIGIVQALNSFEEVEQKSGQIKRWLAWTCGSLEQIALFLEGDGAAKTIRGINFLKPSTQGSGQSSTSGLLDSLLTPGT